MENTYKHLIFDFDGTIVDSFDTMLHIFNQLSAEFSIEPLSKQEVNHLRDMSPKELFGALGLPLYRVPEYLIKARKEYIKHMDTLKCTLGIEKELRRLSATYHLSIITSNDARAVETFLNNHKLRELFDPIQCSMNIFGKHSVIKEFIKDHALIPAEILYIGDEVRDIEASKKAGIDVMSVAWGLNSKKILLKHHPTFLIEKPEELTVYL